MSSLRDTGSGRPAPGREGLPSPSADEREAWAVLAAADGVGPSTFGRLLAAFGSARAVLESARTGSLRRELAAQEVSGPAREGRAHLDGRLEAAIQEAAQEGPRHLARMRALELTILTWHDAAFPWRLHGIEAEPPVLFVRGPIGALARARSVAVVGTRRPTPAGRALAVAIGGAIGACGAAVVSGLAFGIDAAAHHGALEAGGITVAVVGSGHGQLAPRAHAGLANRIVAAGGAVVSELAPHVHPSRGTYPRRNRLIAGLADEVVVAEAPRRSGALNTAHWAAELGRELYAVPGRPLDRSAAGCLYLLHDIPGCRPVVDVPTLVDDLRLAAPPAGHRAAAVTAGGPPGAGASEAPGPSVAAVLATLSGVQRDLAERLRVGPSTADRLAFSSGLPIEQVVAALTLLELRGFARAAGGLYVAAGALAVAW